MRLLYVLNYEEYKKYMSEAANIKDLKLNKAKQLDISGRSKIEIDLEEWNQEAKNEIGTALRIRTGHHHNLSKIHYHKDLQDSQMGAILSQETSNILTEEYKQKLAKMSDESFYKWQGEYVRKLSITLDKALQNLNNIAKKLLESDLDIPKTMDIYKREFPELFIVVPPAEQS